MPLPVTLRLHRSAIILRAFAAGCIVLIALAALAQVPAPSTLAAAKPPAFEVATIKPSPRPDKFPWSEHPTPDGMSWMNVSLQYLVREAYGVTDDQRWSGGPAWLDTQRFDIVARFDASAKPTPALRMQALQALLADRFAMKLHRESKDFPIYNLVVAKGGPRLQETKPENMVQGPGGSTCIIQQRSGITQRQGCPVKSLEPLLSLNTGRAVIDQTGLTGLYDIELHWAPENMQKNYPAPDNGPSIFTAVQEQLGLKLDPAIAPLEVFVIDSAAMPTPN